jgi:hypothetical protein
MVFKTEQMICFGGSLWSLGGPDCMKSKRILLGVIKPTNPRGLEAYSGVIEEHIGVVDVHSGGKW